MKLMALTAALALLATPAIADVKLSDVQAFETSEGMKNGAVLLKIENTATADDKLVSVTTPAADRSEIHEMKDTNGVMQMRKVGAIEVPAGKSVTLDPNGYHIMLMGLKEPLKAGTAHPITFKFLRGGEVLTSFRVVSRKPVSVPAEKATERDAPMNHMEHMDHSAH